MTKRTTTDHAGRIRVLGDAELTAVTGGIIDSCIPVQTILTGPIPNPNWTFKDVFAIPTLGTYH